uniref:OmpA family protein n=1 Tax=Roseihalotalea indica TaxID=2867963 RepID=A0AA49GSE8_9BACT|nr:OmpA family protein [Tunicatimonas sp. TK19036]
MASLKKDANKGDELFEFEHYDEAILHYQKALEESPDDFRLKLQIASCYNMLDEWELSRNWFQSVEMSNAHLITGEYAFQYADALQHLKCFDKARTWYTTAKYSQTNYSDHLITRLESLDSIKSYYEDSSRYYVTPLPFNTDAAEFAPFLYQGGLIFTSYAPKQRDKIPDLRKDVRYDMYFFPLNNTSQTATLNGQFDQVNSANHDGILALYKENTRMIFTRSNTQASKHQKEKGVKVKNVGLFEASFDDSKNTWTNVQPLNLNNIEYSVGHPAITEDGSTLYFVSDMPNGFGGTDLYKSTYSNGEWGSPINLGPTINSSENELFPFVHNDSVLYFASEGHHGLGGLDIYKTTITNSYNEPKIENMGYPINSTGDDFGIIIRKNNLEGFFASNRLSEEKNDNIYRFAIITDYELDENDQLLSKSLGKEWFKLQGTVINKESKAPLLNASISVTDLESRETFETQTDSMGWFAVNIKVTEGYHIKSEKDKFYTYKTSIPFDTLACEHFNHSIEMEEIEVGQKFQLDNIYYDVGAYEVNESATNSLNTLVEFLRDNPNIKIELSSHTDSRGSNSFNLSLSQKRAKAAAEYIIEQGVDISRIKAVGYGENQLSFPCGNDIDCDEERHLMNRRTEFTILDH